MGITQYLFPGPWPPTPLLLNFLPYLCIFLLFASRQVAAGEAVALLMEARWADELEDQQGGGGDKNKNKVTVAAVFPSPSHLLLPRCCPCAL